MGYSRAKNQLSLLSDDRKIRRKNTHPNLVDSWNVEKSASPYDVKPEPLRITYENQ